MEEKVFFKKKSFQANDRGGNGGTFHVTDLIKPKKNVITLQKFLSGKGYQSVIILISTLSHKK